MSQAQEPEMTFDPTFWHEHWLSNGPSAASSTVPANPYVLQEARAHPDPNANGSSASALEVGCGAGNEALALAQAGWEVTAVDTSAEALRIAADRAAAQDLSERVTWVEADATSWSPQSHYDLVTCSYVHTPLPQAELLLRLAEWVAPGGTLLMVGHAPGHHGHHDHGEHGHSEHGHPPEEAADQLQPLADALNHHQWSVSTREVARTVALQDGPVKTLYDVVLRAERR
ncbi:MAG: class I SAM-dependent methyltransferase [Nesterenkonia sp.]